MTIQPLINFPRGTEGQSSNHKFNDVVRKKSILSDSASGPANFE